MAVPRVHLDRLLQGKTPIAIPKQDISRFKDAEEGAPPRVVADSQDFIVYSLKSRTSLRVLPKATVNQLVFKLHTSPVHAARFTNTTGKIIASYSDKEIYVWGIDAEKGETFPYIHCPIENVRGLCWVFGSDKNPILVILDGNSVKTLAVQKLIDQKVDVAPASAWTTLYSNVKPDGKAYVAARGKSLTVCVDGKNLVCGTANNLSGNSWTPADKQPLTHLAYVGTNLIAASVNNNSVIVWNIEREVPLPVLRLELQGLPELSALESTSSTGGQSLLDLYFVNGSAAFVNLDSSVVAWTQLHGQVRPKGFYSSTTTESITILADFGSVLAYSTVTKDQNTIPLGVQLNAGTKQQRNQNNNASPSTAGGNVGAGILPAPRSAVAGAPIIAQPNPMMMMPQQMMAPNYAAAAAGVNPALRNPALATVGGFANAAQQSEALNNAVAASKEELDRALQNLRQMISLTKTVLPVDHQKLSDRALERMADELKLQAGAPSAADSGASDGISYVTSEDDLKFLMLKLTGAITGGIAPAIEEIVQSRLEPVMLEAMGKSNKKDLSAELKGKLDQALANAANDFAQRMEDKIRQHTENTLLGYVSGIKNEYTQALGQLQEIIQQQHEALAEYQRSSILQQLGDLKKEVNKIKSNISAGAAAAGVGAEKAPNPETIVSTAKQFLEAKDYVKGLEWVTRYNEPDLVITLLTTLNDEALAETLISDPAIPDVLWNKIVGFLCMAATVEGVEGSLWWIDAVMADHEALQDNTQLKATIGNFVKQWKSMPGVSPALQKNLTRTSAWSK